MINKKQFLFWEYFFVISIIALTGFEYFFRDKNLLFIVVGPLSFYIFNKRKLKVTSLFLQFLTVILILSLLQCFYFSNDLSISFIFTFRILIYFFVASIIKDKFISVYINVIYYISLISLFLYTLTNIFSSFRNFLLIISKGIIPLAFSQDVITSNPNNTIFFYTISHEINYRNNGPFWEPGMFGVFLVIAFLFSIFKFGLKDLRSIVILFAGISTLSTTTLIALYIILFYYLFSKTLSFKKFFIVFFFIILFFPLYKIDFIGDKIISDVDNNELVYTRTGAMLIHLKQIIESPWIGYGVNINEDQLKRIGSVEVTPNGITNLIRYFGIPISIIIYFLLYLSTKDMLNKITKKNISWFSFFIILVVCFSQDITTRHFFYVIFLMPISNSEGLNK